MKYRGVNKSHKIRKLMIPRNKNRRPSYGITIPYIYIEKYNLENKKFKIEISKKGKFIIHTQIK